MTADHCTDSKYDNWIHLPILASCDISYLPEKYFVCLFIAGVFSWIEAYREGTNFPRIEDLNGAAQAIVRLQDTYKLDIGSLADRKSVV